VSRFALLREQGTCSLTYPPVYTIIENPLCERWVLVTEKQGGPLGEQGEVVQRPGVVNAKYVLDMVLPCNPAS